MTRDEVLKAVEIAAEEASAAAVGLKCTGQGRAFTWYSRQADLLRAAAEIIRASGWRPIAEARQDKPVTCGKHLPHSGDWLVYRFFSAAHAAKEGYTHYFPEPAPPAREATNG